MTWPDRELNSNPQSVLTGGGSKDAGHLGQHSSSETIKSELALLEATAGRQGENTSIWEVNLQLDLSCNGARNVCDCSDTN